MRSRIDQVFRDPIMWNSEGPFLPTRGIRSCAIYLFILLGGEYAHGVVDRWVLLQPFEADHELWWGRVQPTDVLEQEGHHGLHVLGVVGCAGILVFLEDVLNLLGELGDLLFQGGNEQGHGCRTGGDDEVFETLGFSHRELCREHSSPRVPEEIEVVLDFEVFEEVDEFCDKERDGPELDVTLPLGDVGRHSSADLIVEDDGDFVFGPEVGEGEHVIVNDARTSMKDDQGTALSVGEVTVDLVPGLGGLAGARDDKIDLAGSEAFGGHGTSEGVTMGRKELSSEPRGVSLFYLPSGYFFRPGRRQANRASAVCCRARHSVERGIPLGATGTGILVIRSSQLFSRRQGVRDDDQDSRTRPRMERI